MKRYKINYSGKAEHTYYLADEADAELAKIKEENAKWEAVEAKAYEDKLAKLKKEKMQLFNIIDAAHPENLISDDDWELAMSLFPDQQA